MALRRRHNHRSTWPVQRVTVSHSEHGPGNGYTVENTHTHTAHLSPSQGAGTFPTTSYKRKVADDVIPGLGCDRPKSPPNPPPPHLLLLRALRQLAPPTDMALLLAVVACLVAVLAPTTSAAPFECHDRALCNGDECSDHDALLRSGHLCHRFPFYNGYAPIQSIPWNDLVGCWLLFGIGTRGHVVHELRPPLSEPVMCNPQAALELEPRLRTHAPKPVTSASTDMSVVFFWGDRYKQVCAGRRRGQGRRAKGRRPTPFTRLARDSWEVQEAVSRGA